METAKKREGNICKTEISYHFSSPFISHSPVVSLQQDLSRAKILFFKNYCHTATRL